MWKETQSSRLLGTICDQIILLNFFNEFLDTQNNHLNELVLVCSLLNRRKKNGFAFGTVWDWNSTCPEHCRRFIVRFKSSKVLVSFGFDRNLENLLLDQRTLGNSCYLKRMPRISGIWCYKSSHEKLFFNSSGK